MHQSGPKRKHGRVQHIVMRDQPKNIGQNFVYTSL
jgi:hypothetical protein